VQTFLPLPDFKKSLECLDKKRLGNQVYREAVTLIRGGWVNHPASKMWRGYEYQLAEYIIAGCEVLAERGKPQEKLIEEMQQPQSTLVNQDLPPWFGDERLHSSHRSNLLRKDYEHYSQFGWTETTSIPYYWPV